MWVTGLRRILKSERNSERPHYSLALFSSFIYTCTFSKKIEFASKRTLG